MESKRFPISLYKYHDKYHDTINRFLPDKYFLVSFTTNFDTRSNNDLFLLWGHLTFFRDCSLDL